MPAVWEYLTPGGDRNGAQAHRRSGQDRPVRGDRPALHDLAPVPAGAHPASHAQLDQPRPQHLRGVARGRRIEPLHRRRPRPRREVRAAAPAHHPRPPGPGAQGHGRSSASCDGSRGKICFRNRPQYPDAGANLFLYGALNRGRFTNGGGQYEATIFNYATDFDAGGGLLGYADDNWLDGTQSSVFAFVDPSIVEAGYGLSTTTIHEVGHHVGMSHPHDGFDYQKGLDFGPSDRYYFAWSGDESNSIMSYIDLNWDFSQFDLDNHWRTTAAAYLINTNEIAADVLASDDAAAGMAALRDADDEAGLAQAAFRAHDYGWRVRPRQGRLRARQARRIGRGGPRADRHAGVVRPAAGQAGRRDQRDADVRLGRQAGSAFAPRASVGPAASCVQWTGDATAPVATSCVRHDRGGDPVGELHDRARRWGFGRPAGSQRVVGRDPAGPDAVHAPRAVR